MAGVNLHVCSWGLEMHFRRHALQTRRMLRQDFSNETWVSRLGMLGYEEEAKTWIVVGVSY